MKKRFAQYAKKCIIFKHFLGKDHAVENYDFATKL